MFNVLGDISWLAVILAAVILTVLGGVYFGALVAKQYALALGRDPSKKADFKAIGIVGPLFANLATIIASAVLFQVLGINSLGDAIVFGLIVGVGYLAAMTLNIAINPNFPRPFAYTFVNAPYFIVGSVITSLLLFLI